MKEITLTILVTGVSPLVESLTGVIPSEEDADFRKNYYEYLNKKYS